MYLIQRRNESCFKYLLINQNPRNYFEHLFFVNGNGVDFEDGNPVEIVDFNRTIPWTEYHKQEIPFEDIKKYYLERMCDNCLSENFRNKKSIFNRYGKDETDDEIWEKVYKDSDKQISNIKELKFDQITDSNFWYRTFFENNKYYPRLDLSDGYFKLQHLTKETDIRLLNVAVALVDAYIEFYKRVLDGKESIIAYKDKYGAFNDIWESENIKRTFEATKKDLAILTVERKKLFDLINAYWDE